MSEGTNITNTYVGNKHDIGMPALNPSVNCLSPQDLASAFFSSIFQPKSPSPFCSRPSESHPLMDQCLHGPPCTPCPCLEQAFLDPGAWYLCISLPGVTPSEPSRICPAAWADSSCQVLVLRLRGNIESHILLSFSAATSLMERAGLPHTLFAEDGSGCVLRRCPGKLHPQWREGKREGKGIQCDRTTELPGITVPATRSFLLV